MLTLESRCWDEVSFSEGLSLMLENQSKVLQSYRIWYAYYGLLLGRKGPTLLPLGSEYQTSPVFELP